ncbi:retron St85 family effector protein [Ahrensia marina]|nr:retron St85 family effector protein [Ahrensia marina]
MNNIHIHDPNLSFFVCGGPEDVKSTSCISYRDAFLKTLHKSKHKDAHILIAEQLKPHFPNGNYEDLLSFEIEIASISKLVVLFCESFGSATELGTFSSNDAIADRLLIFVDDINHSDNSYIKLGPFRSLVRKYSESHICVMQTNDLNTPINNHVADLTNLDQKEFVIMVDSAINRRLPQVDKLFERSSFNPQKVGHVIRLICGLIQFYGALTIHEIQLLLEEFKVEENFVNRASDLSLCAQMVGWIDQVRGPGENYYVPKLEKKAVSFPFKKGATFSHTQIQPLIRDHYKKADNERFRIIAKAEAEISSYE